MNGDPGCGRRRFLVAGAGSLTALAGCTGGRTDPTTPTPDVTGDVEPTDVEGQSGDGGEPASTPVRGTAASADGESSGTSEGPTVEDGTAPLRLPSLTAPGSPGGPLTVVPPGKVVLLDFFATWCAPCEPEMANLRTVRNRFDRSDVFVVSVTQESDHRTVVRWWEENGGTWPVVVDPTLTATQRFEVTGLPTIVIVGRDGTETFRHVGLAGEERLADALVAALDADGTD